MTAAPSIATGDFDHAFAVAGRVVVITGAASGLGREAAHLFAGAGAKVVLADIDRAGLAETEDALRAAGGTVTARAADVSSARQMDELADAAVHEFGSLDVWINCAGITLWAGVTEASPPDVDKIVGVNMLGTYWGCHAAASAMKRQGRGGAIVNVSSVAGSTPIPALSVYGMTKAAVEQLTRVAAAELGASGIRVNAVAPGWIDTPINASSYRDPEGSIDPARRAEVMQAMAAMSPLGMTGEPRDIALALLYLASDASRFVTGHVLRVSGGV